MNAPDFAQKAADSLLASLEYRLGMEALNGSTSGVVSVLNAARELIAARVPELCQTCEGDGWVAEPAHHCHGGSCTNQCGEPIQADCDDCPTIGQLLAIGAAVMTADDANPNQAPIHYRGTDHHVWASGWDAALDSLRAVQP